VVTSFDYAPTRGSANNVRCALRVTLLPNNVEIGNNVGEIRLYMLVHMWIMDKGVKKGYEVKEVIDV